MHQSLSGLGESLAIETHGLMPKRFPCCGAAHRTLYGVLELRERHGLSLASVDAVTAFVPAFARANLRFDDPQNENEARFILTYCVARVLDSGCLALHDLTLERVRDPVMVQWLSRISVHVKPGTVSEELSEKATPAITRILTKSGRVYEAGVVMAKGTRDAPFTSEENRLKFRDCCRWADREDEVDGLFDLAQSIPNLNRFSVLSERVAHSRGAV